MRTDVDAADHNSEQDYHASPFRVLGIALVVDELGKGARTVLRYPTVSSANDDDDDVFYQLSGRQMAKLFRPKPALCGQPITLSVGGTVFCCCAVVKGVVNETTVSKSVEDGSGVDADDDDDLVLFSLVVALAPRDRTSTFPIGGWMEPTGSLPSVNEGTEYSATNATLLRSTGKVTRSFLCIQRVHISLTRLCRVLEREERRCRYVSVQSKLVEEVRSSFLNGSGWEKYASHGSFQSNAIEQFGNEEVVAPPPPPPPMNQPATGQLSAPSAGQASPISLVSSKVMSINNTGRRTSSAFSLAYDHEGSKAKAGEKFDEEKIDARFIEQEIVETMMVLKSPGYKDIEHPGNLVQDLVQLYHCLGRNDLTYSGLPTTCLSGHDGVVYVNQHLAVSIQALSTPKGHPEPLVSHGYQRQVESSLVRPYHTLLFPETSPNELLESMTVSHGISSPGFPPRRMQQLLRTLSPRKSLVETAFEASLPLHVALELATDLVRHKACFISPVISPSCCMACQSVSAVSEHALGFSQTFGTAVNLFELVSFLTTPPRRTLGEVMNKLSSSNDTSAQILRNSLRLLLLEENNSMRDESTNDASDDDDADEQEASMVGRVRDTERFVSSLYGMVVWLCSHSVLVVLQDYIVKVDASSNSRTSSSSIGDTTPTTRAPQHEGKSESNISLDSLPDSKLFAELQESDCLTGKISLQACCWKTGMDRNKLTNRISQMPNLRIVTRVPTAGDDWNSVVLSTV